jgi:hypothetical protein
LPAAVAWGQSIHGVALEHLQFAGFPVLYWELVNGPRNQREATVGRNLAVCKKMMLVLLHTPGQAQEVPCKKNGSPS